MFRILRTFPRGSVLSIVFCLAASGQESVSYGTVTGQVLDSSGAPTPGAKVDACSQRTGQHFLASSDSTGHYRLSYLPLGSYVLTADQSGFAKREQTVNLSVGQVVDVPIHLQIANSKAEMTVDGQSTAIETARTAVAGTVTPAEVQQLPLNGRNYLDLALLLPGVSRTNTGSTQRFAETSAVAGTGISVAGQRNLANSFVVDGLSANDDAADLAGTFYGQEVIREFQVLTSGSTVEFGRALGGVVNIVTQSGSNQFHGDAYEFFRNQRLDARNALAAVRFPLTQNQYGGTLGGPLWRNRVFFFNNFEGTRQNTAGLITVAPVNTTIINSRLLSSGYRGPLIATGEYPTTLHSNNYFARLDAGLTARDRLSAHYNFYDVNSLNSRNVGGLSTVSRAANLFDRDNSLALNNLFVLTPNVVLESRAQYVRSRLSAPVVDQIGPAVSISGVANFGTAVSSPTGRDIDLYEYVQNVSVQHGAHFVKAGADFLYNGLNIVFPGSLQGQYSFSSLNAFLLGNYSNFQQAFGPAGQKQSNPNLGWYMSDEWRVHPGLTVNAGVRYDLQFVDGPVRTDSNNVAPRLGFAWSPGKSRSTVVRASYGIFYDRIPLRALSNALQRSGTSYLTAVLTPLQAGAPRFPNVLGAFPSGVLTNITTIDPNVQNASSQQASLQLEHSFQRGGVLSVGYEHLRGEHLLMSINQNVPRCSSGFNLCRPNPQVGNNSQYKSVGDSYFDGLLVSWRGQPTAWANYRVSYTFAKAIDTVGQFFFSSPQNNFNIAADRGPSDNDARHRLTFSGGLHAPEGHRFWNGFALSAILNYSSALPYTVLTGSDNNGDTNVNDRPAGLGRNTARGFDSMTIDLRVTRNFALTERLGLEAMFEAFNALNRGNFLVPNGNFGNGPYPLLPAPGFGQPTLASDPRQMQVALRLRF